MADDLPIIFLSPLSLTASLLGRIFGRPGGTQKAAPWGCGKKERGIAEYVPGAKPKAERRRKGERKKRGREHLTAAVQVGPEREQLRTPYETKFRKRKENSLLMRIHVKHGPISKTKVFVIGHRLISCFPEACPVPKRSAH